MHSCPLLFYSSNISPICYWQIQSHIEHTDGKPFVQIDDITCFLFSGVCFVSFDQNLSRHFSDFVRCVMAFSVSKVQANSDENVIAFDSIYDVTSAITLPDDDFIAPPQLQRLRRRLRHHVRTLEVLLS